MVLTKVKMHEAGHLGQLHFIYLNVLCYISITTLIRLPKPNVDNSEEYQDFSCFVSRGKVDTHNLSGESISSNLPS